MTYRIRKIYTGWIIREYECDAASPQAALEVPNDTELEGTDVEYEEEELQSVEIFEIDENGETMIKTPSDDERI